VNERVKALGAEILRLCIEAGGSISGEHGVGSDKSLLHGLDVQRR